MACVVKVAGRANWIPSCATPAEDGMRVESETPEVHAARRAALAMLLSDHVGDCEAPCRATCPAHMDIPRMLREIKAGQLREAAHYREAAHRAAGRAGAHLAPELCEKGCASRVHDAPRFHLRASSATLPDHDLEHRPSVPCRRASRRRAKLSRFVGSGPAGLAAAYYLQQEGCACVLFDDHALPGGNLRYAVTRGRNLPRTVLDQEIDIHQDAGGRIPPVHAHRLGGLPSAHCGAIFTPSFWPCV